MISKEVQAILDRAKQNSSLVASVDLGMQGLSMQVADLQAKINQLPAGNVLSDDDKAALSEAASNLDTSIATLQKDIPANTQASSALGTQVGSLAANPGNSDGGALQGDQAGAQGSDAAKPLAGTGQS